MAETTSGNNLGMGIIIGLLVVGVFLLLYFVLGRNGAVSQNASPQGTNNTGGPSINIPEQIDVNVDPNAQN